MSSYPKSFTYGLTRLNNFSRQNYKILTQAQTSFTENDQIVVDLPVGILDMSTFTMHGLLSTTATGGTTPSTKAPFAEGLIESVYVEAGGVAIQNISGYAQLFNIFRDYQLFDKKSFRGVMQNDTAPAALGNSDVLTNTPIAVYNWLGFLSSCKILDTTLWPQIRLYIRLVPKTALSIGGAVSPTGYNYTLTSVRFSCDILDIADGVYSQMINERLRSAPLEIPYDNVTTIQGGVGTMTSSTRWSTSAHCLEGIIATQLKSTYTDLGHVTATGLSTYFTRIGTGTTYAQVVVNGVPYPSVPLDIAAGDGFVHTAHALNESQNSLGQCNSAIDTHTKWLADFFTIAQSFTYDADGDENRMCGLDARGNQLIGSVNFTGASTSVIPVIYLRHKSLARVGAGKMIEIVI
jgi:hypothetical protein